MLTCHLYQIITLTSQLIISTLKNIQILELQWHDKCLIATFYKMCNDITEKCTITTLFRCNVTPVKCTITTLFNKWL